MRGGYDQVDGMDGVGSGMGPLADSESHPIAIMDDDGSFRPSSPSPRRHRLLSGLMTQAERVMTVHQRLKNTMTCIVIYAVIILLNVFVMAWEMSGRGYHPVLVVLECLITLLIVGEVSLGVLGQGREYFRSWINSIDFVLAVCCVVFFASIAVTDTVEAAGVMSEVDAVLLACRFLFQLVRLSVLIYRSRAAALMQAQEDVDFNAINLEACIDADSNSRRASERHFSIDSIDGRLPATDDVGVTHTPTSYIHLKPSVYLELQTARAFAQDHSVHAHAPPVMSHEPVAKPLSSYGISGSPRVPILTPPMTPDSLEHLEGSLSSGSSAADTANGTTGFTRTPSKLHPSLAHDNELDGEDESHLAHDLSAHINSALAQRADNIHDYMHEHDHDHDYHADHEEAALI